MFFKKSKIKSNMSKHVQLYIIFVVNSDTAVIFTFESSDEMDICINANGLLWPNAGFNACQPM